MKKYIFCLICCPSTLVMIILFGFSHVQAEEIEFDGLIEPYMEVNLGSGVPGIIENITVDRGDFVKQGQVLVKLESGVEKANLKIAQTRADLNSSIDLRRARLKFLEIEQVRMESLHEKQVVPVREREEAELNKNIAKLELAEMIERKILAELEVKQAQKVLERRIIKSPISGVVVERILSPGEYVENQPILKIVQIDPLYVEVIASVQYLGKLKSGMKVKVIPEGPDKKLITGKVKIVDQVIDAASGTFGFRVEIPNPDYAVAAGLKCKVLISNLF